MSKTNYEGKEMQVISMNEAYPMHEEIPPLIPLISKTTNGNISSNQFCAPPRRNSTKVSYLNEKDMNPERSSFQGQKPDPAFIHGKGHYKESSLTYHPIHTRRSDFINRGADIVHNSNVIPQVISGKKAIAKGISPNRIMERPTQYHTFLADAADVRQIEDGLLKLMEEFQTGNLRAFGKDSRLHQMEEIREQQEKLAKLHFDVGAEQDSYPPLSEDGLRISDQNMRTLMAKLADLSESIENLHTNSTERKTSTNEKKTGSLDKKNGDQRSTSFPFPNCDKDHSRSSNVKVEVHSARQEVLVHENGLEHSETVVLRKT